MTEHNEFCEGHLTCPETGKDECSKVMNYKIYADGGEVPCTVFCFGCGKTHDVEVDSSEFKENGDSQGMEETTNE